MSGPKCIVCGKAIAKRTETIYFKQATPEHPNGSKEVGYSMHTIYLDVLPTTKTEAQRHVNQQVVSVSRGQDRVWSVGVWDGESYDDKFFHSTSCAAKQGYASAQHGARFTWSK